MIEIRFHGRGGQGAVTASRIIAIAAYEEGMYSQAIARGCGLCANECPVDAIEMVRVEA